MAAGGTDRFFTDNTVTAATTTASTVVSVATATAANFKLVNNNNSATAATTATTATAAAATSPAVISQWKLSAHCHLCVKEREKRSRSPRGLSPQDSSYYAGVNLISSRKQENRLHHHKFIAYRNSNRGPRFHSSDYSSFSSSLLPPVISTTTTMSDTCYINDTPAGTGGAVHRDFNHSALSESPPSGGAVACGCACVTSRYVGSPLVRRDATLVSSIDDSRGHGLMDFEGSDLHQLSALGIGLISAGQPDSASATTDTEKDDLFVPILSKKKLDPLATCFHPRLAASAVLNSTTEDFTSQNSCNTCYYSRATSYLVPQSESSSAAGQYPQVYRVVTPHPCPLHARDPLMTRSNPFVPPSAALKRKLKLKLGVGNNGASRKWALQHQNMTSSSSDSASGDSGFVTHAALHQLDSLPQSAMKQRRKMRRLSSTRPKIHTGQECSSCDHCSALRVEPDVDQNPTNAGFFCDANGTQFYYHQPTPAVMAPMGQSSAHPPPTYCYLSIRKTKKGTYSPAQQNKAIDSQSPLITISVPPNCHFVSEYGDLQRRNSTSSDDLSSAISDLDLRTSSPISSDELSSSNEDMFMVSTSAPPTRSWIPLSSNANAAHNAKFTVFCYNVLCDKYATPTMYSYCPSWALDWNYRREKILDDLQLYNADIFALQEVETSEYHTTFLPAMEQRGYAGIFSPKSRAKTMAEEDRGCVDGCAVFWKRNKFTLKKQYLMEFTQIAIDKAEGSERMLNRVMTRDNIGLVAVVTVNQGIYDNLQSVDQGGESVIGDPLVICTAHIHWDPEYCDVKLVQSMMLVQELTRIVGEVAHSWSKTNSEVPIVFCGDLNSLPDSGVYDYMTAGKISVEHQDLLDFKGDQCLHKLTAVSADKRNFIHSLKFTSAYTQDMMHYTNYTFDFKGMIDYVFATEKNLERLAVLGPLDPDWFAENKVLGCPHPMIPSDHFPLMVQYGLKPTRIHTRR